MTEEKVITDEMRRTMGQLLFTQVVEIEKGMIERFVTAIEDPNPLWSDEEFAKKSRYHSIIAPPSFVYGLNYFGKPPIESFMELQPFKLDTLMKYLDGGIECEFFKVIRPGDILFSTITLANLYERSGSSGKMLFTVYRVKWTNQKGEMIANVFRTIIRY